MSVLSVRHCRTADTALHKSGGPSKSSARSSSHLRLSLTSFTPIPVKKCLLSSIFCCSHTKRQLSQRSQPSCPQAKCYQSPKIKAGWLAASFMASFCFIFDFYSSYHYTHMCFLSVFVTGCNKQTNHYGLISMFCLKCDQENHLRLIMIFSV